MDQLVVAKKILKIIETQKKSKNANDRKYFHEKNIFILFYTKYHRHGSITVIISRYISSVLIIATRKLQPATKNHLVDISALVTVNH